jgi:LysM repeat protein
MSIYKYIIILLPALFVINCAPGDHFRRTDGNSFTNDSFFEWSDTEKGRFEYDESSSTDSDDEDNYEITKRASSETINPNTENYNNHQIRNSGKSSKITQNKYAEIDQQKYEKQTSNVKTTAKYKTYKVVKGDNLSKISDKFNVPVSELLKINKIKNNDKIQLGMLIKIPDKKIPIISGSSNQYRSISEAPRFIWPMKSVYSAKRDGQDGVKPIGIIITGNSENCVLSSADGIIKKIGHMRGFGNYIIIKHVNKYLTIYSNLKKIEVTEGDRIKSGELLGKIEGNKLHFQIGKSGKPEDPLMYLSRIN